MELIVIVVCALAGVFALWTAFCLLLKGMFKIADWVFGL